MIAVNAGLSPHRRRRGNRNVDVDKSINWTREKLRSFKEIETRKTSIRNIGKRKLKVNEERVLERFDTQRAYWKQEENSEYLDIMYFSVTEIRSYRNKLTKNYYKGDEVVDSHNRLHHEGTQYREEEVYSSDL